jgi:hypothetical protein
MCLPIVLSTAELRLDGFFMPHGKRSVPMKHRHLLLFVLVLATVLLFTACGAPPATPSTTTRPTPPNGSPGCPHPQTPAALLFFYQEGHTRSRCLTPSAASPDQEQPSEGPQPVTPPVDGVFRVCALQTEVLVSYESFVDPRVRASSALGRIDLNVALGQCATPQQVGVASFTVTSIWFSPFFGVGAPGSPTPQLHLIRPLGTPACFQHRETLLLWAGTPPTPHCFAGLGTLQVAPLLQGVSKLCSGSATGLAIFHPTLISGLEVELEPHSCILIPLLLHEDAISVDTISIEAPAGS